MSEPNYSERYLYNIVSINPPGSDPHLVYEAIRKNGVIPQEMLPITDTLEEFKTPRPMTDKYKNEGRKWLGDYTFEHRWLTDTSKESLIENLKICPIGVSVTAWSEKDGVYVDNGQQNTHWCVAFAPAEYKGRKTVKVFDSYDHSIKILHPDHKISYAKKILIQKKSVAENEEQAFISGLIDWVIKVWKTVLLLIKNSFTLISDEK